MGHVLLGPVDKRGLKPTAGLVGLVQTRSQPETQIGRDLVVARAGGVQAAGSRADQRGKPCLDIHVDVFERAVEGKAAGLDLIPHPVQAVRDRDCVFLRHDSLRRQHGDVSDGARDILRVEPPVEVDGGVDRLHHLVGRCLEAAAPHAVGRVVRGRLEGPLARPGMSCVS